MKNALISVSNKENLVEFAKKLKDIGYTIYATNGTAKFLESNGVEVKRLSEITKLKESKTVKTLHPEVFERIYNGFFDIVVVNLYDPTEEIDIGGVAILRASAKNYKKVLVVCDVDDYDEVIKKIKYGVDEKFKLKLAVKAFEYVIDYDKKVVEILKSKRLA